jgi:hypothetical protein
VAVLRGEAFLPGLLWVQVVSVGIIPAEAKTTKSIRRSAVFYFVIIRLRSLS